MTTTSAPTISLERKVPPFGGFNLTMLRIEMARRLRNRRNVIFAIALPVAMFLLIGLQVKDIPLDPHNPVANGGLSVASYIMFSMAVYGCMITGVAAGGSVGVERAQGWSRQLRLTPLNPVANIAVKVIGAMALGVISVIAVIIAGLAMGLKMPLHVWIVGGLASLLGSLVFTALGLMIGYLLPSDNTMQFMGPAVAFLAFFGGLFTPLQDGWMKNIGVWTPTYGLGQIARGPLTGDVDATAWLNVIAWMAIFILGAAWAFRRDTNRV